MLPIIKHSAFVFIPPAFIYPSFVNFGTVSTGGPANSFSLTPGFPSGLEEGDLLIGTAVAYNRNAAGAPTIATPSGWNHFYPYGFPTFNSRITHTFYRFYLGASDPGSVSIEVRAAGSSTEISGIARIHAYRGVRPSSPFDPEYSQSYASGEPAANYNGFTTSEPYSMGLRFSTNGSNASLSLSNSSGAPWTENSSTFQGPFTSGTGDSYFSIVAESTLVPTISTISGGDVVWNAGQGFATQGLLLPIFGGGSASQGTEHGGEG